jgi:hypothetical protein
MELKTDEERRKRIRLTIIEKKKTRRKKGRKDRN